MKKHKLKMLWKSFKRKINKFVDWLATGWENQNGYGGYR